MILKKQVLKRIALLFLLLDGGASYVAARPTSVDFSLTLTLTRGEHSRDSHSTIDEIKINGNRLSFSRTYYGARASKQKSLSYEFRLTNDELKKLKHLLKDQSLFTSVEKEFPDTTRSRRYFIALLEIKRASKSNRIQLSGSSAQSEIKDDALFQRMNNFVHELYGILQKHAPNLDEPDLVL